VHVLMLGWEFPPFISGGLGTACYGLTRAMSHLQAQILFVLPGSIEVREPHSTVVADEMVPRSEPRFHSPERAAEFGRTAFAVVPSAITSPYLTTAPAPVDAGTATHTGAARQSSTAVPWVAAGPPRSALRVLGTGVSSGYDGDLLAKIQEYADRCLELARGQSFDVIHAHEWVTFGAAQAVACVAGKPLVVHVHATEFDRSGEHVHQAIYDIERQGMHAATRVIAVSGRTKETLVTRYGMPASKVEVVHNGIDADGADGARSVPRRSAGDKVVLFLGRITRQKGPEFFVRAAAQVLQQLDRVRFVMAGAGDLSRPMQDMVAALGLSDRFEFTGFLRGAEVERAYRTADLYVMPSVSEPFGLTALEAVRYGVPVILSRSSGAAEVLRRGAWKVDFWDVDRMANMMVTMLKYPGLASAVSRCGAEEIRGLSWHRAAQACMRVYEEVIAERSA
jgi:glycogen(starch) synthase